MCVHVCILGHNTEAWTATSSAPHHHTPPSAIATVSATIGEVMDEAVAAIVRLKEDRDAWRAIAEKYKAAFEEQATRFDELQDICVATQAELENARMLNRRRKGWSASFRDASGSSLGAAGAEPAMATDTANALVSGSNELCWQLAPNPSSFFHRVEQLASNCDYRTALEENERLLQGPLAPGTRVEGLLLKSGLMRKTECLYDALAACGEGIELCYRLEELQSHLPRLRYQQGLCYYQLNMLQQARDAFSHVSPADGSLHAHASALRTSCEDRLLSGRRPGLKVSRSATDGLLATNYHRYDVRSSSVA
jgi:hypothetical protein